MKEGGGGDHLSVGVRKPRSRRITPVSRKNVYLRPPGKQIVPLVATVVSSSLSFSFSILP